MSSSLSYRSELTTTFPALDPGISADITDGLLAAVPRPADSAGADDRFGRDITLISEVDAFHPRDLEETILVVQVLSAHHSAIECFRAATQCEVTSKEASRLRRDAIAMQRALAATLRALHKSQARPISDEDLVPRPAVPTSRPRRTERETPPPEPVASPAPPPPRHDRAAPTDAAGPANGHAANPGAEPDNAEPGNASSSPSRGDRDPLPPAPKPRVNPFEGHPDLQRLNDRWNDLPPWEQMTMEERRETWGYTYTPKDGANPAAV